MMILACCCCLVILAAFGSCVSRCLVPVRVSYCCFVFPVVVPDLALLLPWFWWGLEKPHGPM